MGKPIRFERIDTGNWSIDGDLENADWIKLSWNLPRELDGFIRYLNVDGQPTPVQRKAVDNFMQLPVARQMPKTLHKALVDAELLEA